MKLTELKPHWITLNGWAAPDPFYIGISFLCPHCDPALPEHGQTRRKRLAVSFWPPIDPSGMLGRMFELPVHPNAHKRVSGDTYEDLTLEPSIGFDSIGHWHGWIIKGEIQ